MKGKIKSGSRKACFIKVEGKNIPGIEKEVESELGSVIDCMKQLRYFD